MNKSEELETLKAVPHSAMTCVAGIIFVIHLFDMSVCGGAATRGNGLKLACGLESGTRVSSGFQRHVWRDTERLRDNGGKLSLRRRGKSKMGGFTDGQATGA